MKTNRHAGSQSSSASSMPQFKTHATVKLDSLHLQGIAGDEPDGGWGSLEMRCYGKGGLLPKICQSSRWGAGDILSPRKKPCCQKGVRISPSVYILLTLGQTLRDTLTCIQLHSVFNSLHYFLTAFRCTQLSVAIDTLTLNTMRILLEAEEKQGLHTSFLPSHISHFWD